MNVSYEHFATKAGLRYVSEEKNGIERRRQGKKFVYFDAKGRKIQDPKVIARINSLAIPPAYTDVWICPFANGHLQGTGRDARNRKQYRYHPKWRQVRDQDKFHRMIHFAQALPRIRKVTLKHLALSGLPRKKVLATIVQLLEKTLIRVGNEEYARTNASYGLTTMRDRHVNIRGSTLTFEFKGKSKVHHTIDLQDYRLARIVKKCQEIPGYELFQYRDESGVHRRISSEDVNAYLHEIAGDTFTAKDFRTWAASVLAALALQEVKEFASETEAKRNLNAAIESVAKKLGNTKSICRKCYVHPAVIEAYLDGDTLRTAEQISEHYIHDGFEGLTSAETAVLALLKRRIVSTEKQFPKNRVN